MKLQLTGLVVASLAAGLAHGQSNNAPTKVGTINIQQAIVSTKDGQKAATELQTRFDPRRKALETKQQEITGLQDQFRKVGNTGSEELKARLARDIDQKTKSLQRDSEDAQAEFDQEQQKLIQDLGGRIMQVLDKYGRDNSYTLILDVSSQNTPVLFMANGIDLTNEIVQLYDKNAPSTIPAARPTGIAPSPVRPTGSPAVAPPKKPAGVK